MSVRDDGVIELHDLERVPVFLEALVAVLHSFRHSTQIWNSGAICSERDHVARRQELVTSTENMPHEKSRTRLRKCRLGRVLTLVIIVGDQVLASRTNRDTAGMHANLNCRSSWRDFSSLGQDSRITNFRTY